MKIENKKNRAPRNRTLVLNDSERKQYAAELMVVPAEKIVNQEEVRDCLFNCRSEDVIPLMPDGFVDLMITDPPYNLDKNFHGMKFRGCSDAAYYDYCRTWFEPLLRLLKPDASVYVCCDWKSSAVIYRLLSENLTVRNRITWQREKGRAANHNWKNVAEDIWFATAGKEYYFDAGAVRQKRRVLAPYRSSDGKARDWQAEADGRFRLTAAANFWDDISVPFWSMPENTAHPTQKPEKLVAKLILASSRPGAMVFDPFSGSGTTAVVAKKLGRSYCSVEINEEYCLWAAKRLENAANCKTIQGYQGGVFWERNTLAEQFRKEKNKDGEQ